jgi:3-methyladenine DNA glycosylase/8-oxoguanine DNA glycosylase
MVGESLDAGAADHFTLDNSPRHQNVHLSKPRLQPRLDGSPENLLATPTERVVTNDGAWFALVRFVLHRSIDRMSAPAVGGRRRHLNGNHSFTLYHSESLGGELPGVIDNSEFDSTERISAKPYDTGSASRAF